MRSKYTLCVFLSSICFALGGLCFKVITWEPMAISSARSILAVIVVFIFLRIRRHQFKINRTVLITALTISMTNILYSFSNKLTTAGNAIVLQFSMPIFVIILVFVLFHKKPDRLELTSCILVMLGIVFFFIDSLSAGNMLGNLLALISGFTYACYFVLNQREEADPFTSLFLSYFLTMAVGLPALFHTSIAASAPKVLIAVLVLGIVQQGMAQIFLAIGIRKTPPVTASLVSGIEPILNPTLVALFYHEMLTPLSFVGAAIVLATVMIYNLRTAMKKQQV